MQFEYKVLAINVIKRGWLRPTPESATIREVDQTLQSMGALGWELVSVLPVTNGGSPAQIDVGLHYFKRPIDD